MTAPGADYAALSAIIARTRYLLLDFDGPICSIYSGLPASKVADQLKTLFSGDLPNEIAATSDPIVVFSYSASASDEMAVRVEAEMTDLEVAAAAIAEPTPYVNEVIASAHESGRIIAVVSNNSPHAVNAYLDRHGLSDGIRLVVARTSHDPALLKPNPHLIHEAVRDLDATAAASTLVGDSFTDIEAAHHAGVASIGYANQPGKRARMTELQAGAVITSMADLALSLRAHPVNFTG
jgi:phosphoglycolate phosphatase